MFLQLDFLELDELGAATLEVEATARPVGGAVLTRAQQQRHKRQRRDLQVYEYEGLKLLACTSVDMCGGFDRSCVANPHKGNSQTGHFPYLLQGYFV